MTTPIQINFDEAYERLNPEQRRAVDHIEGPMMVLAGPGTGKTQIIAMRIARILQQTQMDPHNLLCLTFTESGVVAMRKRLLSIIGPAAYYVRIHTFHSFCNDVIREFPEKFLFARELESLTDVERVQILRKILDELPANSPITPFGAPYLYQRDCARLIQSLKREAISPEDFSRSLTLSQEFLKENSEALEACIAIHGNSLKASDLLAIQPRLAHSPLQAYAKVDLSALDKKGRTQFKNQLKAAFLKLKSQLPKQQALAQVYAGYQSELQARGRYDFEDMILFVVERFREDAELLAQYQEQFQYILVDEYQDTNGAQNQVVQLIAEYFERPNIFVVGDDKQSIYRFQGASLENLLYFYQRYKGKIQLVSLRQNYRSQQGILDAAHALIQNNQHSLAAQMPEIQQELQAAQDLPATALRVAQLDSPQSEHYFLAKEVQKLIAAGTKPSEIAILYRNNWDVQELMPLFLRLDIPFRLEAGVDILKDPHIAQLLKFLEALQDPLDGAKLFPVLHYDFLGLPTFEVLKITRAAADRRRNLFELMSETPQFAEFTEQVLHWHRLANNSTLSEWFDRVIKECGFLDRAMTQPDTMEQLNRLNTLFDQVKQLNRAQHDLTLAELLEHFELLRENHISIKEHELRTQKNAVRLMTAHKSKGLEFEHVFLMKCVDKHWGNNPERGKIKLPEHLIQTAGPKERNEDERRLFYVALTRAKRSVTLSSAAVSESGRAQIPSIFLSELPQTQTLDTTAIEDEAIQRLQTLFLNPKPPAHSEDERDYLRGLLQNYTMSVTHLNNYLRCPRLFYYRNLLRVPSAKNKHLAFGSAIHDSLNDFAQAYNQQRTPSKEYLLQRFERHLKRQVMTQQDFRGGLEFGQQTLSEYFDAFATDFEQKPSLSEYDFRSHGVNLDGIPLTGKLDKIEFNGPPERGAAVHVIDYKTGNPDTKSKALGPDGDYRRQILFYKLLCDLSPQFPYTMNTGEIQFVQKSPRDQQFKRRVITPKAEELAQLKQMIRAVYEDITQLKFLDDEWTRCGECEYCP